MFCQHTIILYLNINILLIYKATLILNPHMEYNDPQCFLPILTSTPHTCVIHIVNIEEEEEEEETQMLIPYPVMTTEGTCYCIIKRHQMVK